MDVPADFKAFFPAGGSCRPNPGRACPLPGLTGGEEAEKGDGIYVKFILDESINTVIKSILGESYENIQSESATFLDKVNSEIKKLQVEFDKKIEQFSADKVARRNTTQQRSEAVVEKQPQTSYTTNETQVRRQGQNVTKKEDTSDEWA